MVDNVTEIRKIPRRTLLMAIKTAVAVPLISAASALVVGCDKQTCTTTDEGITTDTLCFLAGLDQPKDGSYSLNIKPYAFVQQNTVHSLVDNPKNHFRLRLDVVSLPNQLMQITEKIGLDNEPQERDGINVVVGPVKAPTLEHNVTVTWRNWHIDTLVVDQSSVDLSKLQP